MSEKGETLTQAMLDRLPAKLRAIKVGKFMRAGCPFHGSDKQRSLYIDIESGRFGCHVCPVWGYTEESRERWKAQHGGQPARPLPPWERRTGADRLRPDNATMPAPITGEWRSRLEAWQAALPEAADYLAGRRIPLELVREIGGGVGMLAGARRLVLPHTDPSGAIVSLYGRRIDGGDDDKHHHLPGPTGWLNAAAAKGREVWLTEGPFDALALMAAGVPHAAAIFGTNGVRWEWLRGVQRIVLAFDMDPAGDQARERHGREAHMRGLEVLELTPDELGGKKDIAEAWAAGVLQLSGITPAPANATTGGELARLRALVAALPDAPPPGLPGATWMDYHRQALRFAETHLGAALEAGWTEAQLFGLPHPQRPWEAGALWLLAPYEIQAVKNGHIHAATDRGAPQVARRDGVHPHGLPWDAQPAATTP